MEFIGRTLPALRDANLAATGSFERQYHTSVPGRTGHRDATESALSKHRRHETLRSCNGYTWGNGCKFGEGVQQMFRELPALEKLSPLRHLHAAQHQIQNTRKVDGWIPTTGRDGLIDDRYIDGASTFIRRSFPGIANLDREVEVRMVTRITRLHRDERFIIYIYRMISVLPMLGH